MTVCQYFWKSSSNCLRKSRRQRQRREVKVACSISLSQGIIPRSCSFTLKLVHLFKFPLPVVSASLPVPMSECQKSNLSQVDNCHTNTASFTGVVASFTFLLFLFDLACLIFLVVIFISPPASEPCNNCSHSAPGMFIISKKCCE